MAPHRRTRRALSKTTARDQGRSASPEAAGKVGAPHETHSAWWDTIAFIVICVVALAALALLILVLGPVILFWVGFLYFVWEFILHFLLLMVLGP
jgi:fatty acid desaturase